MKRKDPRLAEVHLSWRQRATYNAYQLLDHFISRPITNKLVGKLRYRSFESVKKSLQKKGDGRLINVERRKDLSDKELKEHYIRKGIPVVLEGKAKDWPCVKNWSPQFIKDHYGNDEVPLIDAIYLEKGVQYEKLGKIIDQVLAGQSSYLRFYNLLAKHPERFHDFDHEWFRKQRQKDAYVEFTQVFIGGKNSQTGLHNAHADNLFVQVYGEKEWVLYPNDFMPIIDPPSTTSGTHRVAPKRGKYGQPFDPFKPDYEDYPMFKHIDGYHVVLQPGDILYNPPYMWHAVKNRTENIGLGYRWISPSSALSVSPFYYFLDLCAYRPTYFKAYKWYKDDGNAEFLYAEKMLRKHLEKQEKKKAKV